MVRSWKSYVKKSMKLHPKKKFKDILKFASIKYKKALKTKRKRRKKRRRKKTRKNTKN